MKPETAASPKGVSPSFPPTGLRIFKAVPHLFMTHFTYYINVWQSIMDWIRISRYLESYLMWWVKNPITDFQADVSGIVYTEN